jgi:hypothetical protein
VCCVHILKGSDGGGSQGGSNVGASLHDVFHKLLGLVLFGHICVLLHSGYVALSVGVTGKCMLPENKNSQTSTEE